MKTKIRDAQLTDLDRLVTLHMESYDANELSVILGQRFVRAFYTLCVNDPDVRVRVLDYGHNRVVALSVVFFCYSEFENKFKRSALPLFGVSVAAMLCGFNFGRFLHVVKSIRSRNLCESIDSPERYNHYVGSFIVDKRFGDQACVVIAFFKMLADNVKKLKKHSTSGIWGSCRVSNQASLRLLKDRGMKELVRVEAFPEAVFLCLSVQK